MPDKLSLMVKNFLWEHIESVDQLRVLILVSSDPNKQWTAVEVSYELSIEPLAAATWLGELYRRGLLGHEPKAGKLYGYRFSPPASSFKIIKELKGIYSAAQDEVVDCIESHRRGQAIGA